MKLRKKLCKFKKRFKATIQIWILMGLHRRINHYSKIFRVLVKYNKNKLKRIKINIKCLKIY